MGCRGKSPSVVLLFIVLVAGTIIFTLFRSYQKNGAMEPVVLTEISHEPGQPIKRRPGQLPPCGQVCDYTVKHAFPGRLWPRLQKNINCDDVMGRMAWRHYNITYPPPKQPPHHQLQQFQQNGDCRFGENWYLVNFGTSRGSPDNFSSKQINNLMANDRAGKHISVYGDGYIISNMVKDYRKWIHGKHGFVVGTQIPWLEAMLLNANASHVTTLEYNALTLDHPKLDVIDPYSFAEKYLQGKKTQFDFGATFSSMEHSGLGRYGDPLNPYGDLEAMAQAWCMTKPGGLFLLGLPGGYTKKNKCYIRFNAGRWYGPARNQHMTANWDVLDAKHSGRLNFVLALKRMDL